MFSSRSLFLAGLSLLPAAVLHAQEAGEPGKPVAREQRVRAEGQNPGQLDKFFVSCLRSDNKGEVTIAQLAAQKATDPEVKAFAQEMVKDHTSFLANLNRFDQEAPADRPTGTTTRTERRQTEAPGRRDAKPDATDRSEANPDAKDRREVKPDATDRSDSTPRAERKAERKSDSATQPGARTDAPRGEARRSEISTTTTVHGTADGGNELMQIKQEIADRCLASAQRELNAKQGKEFDKCFIGMQIGAHMHMVDTLSVFNNHASAELQQVIEEGLKTSQQHLEHAKMLAKKLDDSSAATGERRTVEKPVTSPERSDRKGTEKPK